MMSPHDNWREQRAQLSRRVQDLRARGICDTCYSLTTGDLYDDAHVIAEDDLFKIVLEAFPRARGHTIVIYKPHRDDLSALDDDEAGLVFQICVRLVKAIKRGLGAEKVYLNTMCDGPINHLHLQLIPRYAGDPIGSGRFVAERGPLTGGDETARHIRAALAAIPNDSDRAIDH